MFKIVEISEIATSTCNGTKSSELSGPKEVDQADRCVSLNSLSLCVPSEKKIWLKIFGALNLEGTRALASAPNLRESLLCDL